MARSSGLIQNPAIDYGQRGGKRSCASVINERADRTGSTRPPFPDLRPDRRPAVPSEEKNVNDQQHQDRHEQDGGEEGVPPAEMRVLAERLSQGLVSFHSIFANIQIIDKCGESFGLIPGFLSRSNDEATETSDRKSPTRIKTRDGSSNMKMDNLNQALKAASAGIEMAISILIGCILGYAVASLFDEGSGYIGLIIGAILGLISGTYSLYRRYG